MKSLILFCLFLNKDRLVIYCHFAFAQEQTSNINMR